MELFTLEQAIKISKPIAKKFFKEKLKPLIEKKIGNYLKTKQLNQQFEKGTVDYLTNLLGRCSIMNTIAFQNMPKKFNDLYLPLTVINQSMDSLLIDDESDIFEQHNHILINDTAGMGKSTLAKRVILNEIFKGDSIPVFIELRQLKNEPVDKQVGELFNINLEKPSEFLHNLPLIFIFDGIDEVPDDIKSSVIKYLTKFVDDFKDHKILITSRKEAFLSEFYSFKQYTIQPLVEKEAFSLLVKYDPEGNLSKKLISSLQKENAKSLVEFLATPLYVSLLFCSYRFKTIIPQKKQLFYSQVFSALFESHDLSKDIGYVREKFSGLDSADFHTLLRRLGFWCLKNNGQIEFQKDELEIIVTGLLQKLTGINTRPSAFVKDLITTVPIFVEEGSVIRWSHKSLMEYFAAMFICHDTKLRQHEIMLKLYNSSSWGKYMNVFELCADIDFGGFRSSILKEILINFMDYSTSLSINSIKSSVDENDFKIRIGLMFSTCIGISSAMMAESEFESDELRLNCNLQYASLKTRTIHFSKHSFVTEVVIGKEKEILKMIRSKIDHLLIRNDIKYKDAEKALFKPKFNLKDAGFTEVTDDISSKVNQPEFFKTANAIFYLNNDTNISLDIDLVIDELNQIETDGMNGVSDLLDGF